MRLMCVLMVVNSCPALVSEFQCFTSSVIRVRNVKLGETEFIEISAISSI